jgi:hypothetical protein
MSVAGQVRIEGETRRSPSDVKVQLEASDWNYVHRAEVDGDGQLTIRTIEPDVWLVIPFAPPDLYVKSIHWGTADITDTELDLTGGVPPRTELSIVLAADGGEVSGVVRNDKQEAVDGAVVTLVPAGGSKWCYRTVNTDAGGRFMIRAIAPGSYRLWAWDKVDPNAVMFDPDFLTPYKAAAVPVEIKPGEKKPADLAITTM